MPTPYKHILLATEGTEFDIGAQRIAIDLAAYYKLPLSAVLPLVSNPVYESLAPEQESKAEAEAAAMLEQVVQAAKARNVDIQSKIRLGEEPCGEIVDEAEEQQADLIIARRRGKRSYMANLLLGEMVHSVTSYSPCDVLLVPRASQLWSKGILLATDGSEHSDRATTMAAAVAKQHDLPVTVVSVYSKADSDEQKHAEDSVERALTSIRAEGVTVEGRTVHDSAPAEAIIRVAEETELDLIIIGRRGINRVKRFFVGSISEKVAGRSSGPVLIVRDTAASY